MKMRVTAIPEDSMVNVDGEVLFFAFTAPYPVRVLQWKDDSGQLEYEDVSRNILFGEDRYAELVAPFVTLWEAEKARLEKEANRQPTFAEARAAKLAEVITGYSAAFAPIEAVYPAEERETWPIQLEEARAVLADAGAQTPMLSIMVAVRSKGETVADFARIVMANNAVYRQVAGYLTGQQQRMFAEVSVLGTTAEIQAYNVAYAVPEGFGSTGL